MKDKKCVKCSENECESCLKDDLFNLIKQKKTSENLNSSLCNKNCTLEISWK